MTVHGKCKIVLPEILNMRNIGVFRSDSLDIVGGKCCAAKLVVMAVGVKGNSLHQHVVNLNEIN